MTNFITKALSGGWNSPLLTGTLKTLEKPAVKYSALSVITMGIPRAWVDFNRNDAMGWETVRYEVFGTTTNYLLPGILAGGIAWAVEKVSNLTNPEKLNLSFWADNKNIDALTENWKNAKGDNKDKKALEFIKKTLGQIIGDSNENNKLENGFINEQAERLSTIIVSSKRQRPGKDLEKISKKIANKLGTTDRITLKPHKLDTTVDALVDNIYDLTGKIFKKADNLENAVGRLKFTNKFKTIGAMAIAGAMTFSSQYINRFITKKETGVEGYVGYSELKGKLNHEQINKDDKKKTPAFKGWNFTPPSYGFEGPFPNSNVIKFWMVPLSFIGGTSASRDFNELEERLIRGGAAVINLFFIPGLAGKIAACCTDAKEHIMTKPDKFWGSAVKSYKDIEAYAAKSGNGDGFLKKLNKAKNMSKVAELAYAIIAVGIAIPTLSKILVDSNHEKDLAKTREFKERNKLKNPKTHTAKQAAAYKPNSLINNSFGIIEYISKSSALDNPFAKFVKERTK